MKLTRDEKVQVCYLRAAEFVKAAAAEDGDDADAAARNMTDEELAEVLDEVVQSLAADGAFEDVLAVEEDGEAAAEESEEGAEQEAGAEEGEALEAGAENAETEVEAESGIVEKTAALLDKFAAPKQFKDLPKWRQKLKHKLVDAEVAVRKKAPEVIAKGKEVAKKGVEFAKKHRTAGGIAAGAVAAGGLAAALRKKKEG
jgi:hypothetical protein